MLAEPLLANDNFELAVSIVMPCLNEMQSLPHCIANARLALTLIQVRYALAGEVVVADNGSTDGSQALAERLGARVIAVSAKGYGAALIGGFNEAYGRFLVMGDADGSYDFTDAVPMIGSLLDGADLCIGSRFKGGIGKGAMPWKNRYIGNPALTGILNLFFRSGVDDAHCGLRAIRREAYEELALEGRGMEFASEMVIKASLKRMRTDQVPAKLSPDLRDRAPHLRPWRDGWRHLRYLFMLSPTWAFAVPAVALMFLGFMVLLAAGGFETGLLQGPALLGPNWTVLGAFALTTGHFAILAALLAHVHGVQLGYRSLHPLLRRLAPWATLEHALVGGGALVLMAVMAIVWIGAQWSANGFAAPASMLPVSLAAIAGATGFQTILGAFVLAIIAGHNPKFLSDQTGA